MNVTMIKEWFERPYWCEICQTQIDKEQNYLTDREVVGWNMNLLLRYKQAITTPEMAS